MHSWRECVNQSYLEVGNYCPCSVSCNDQRRRFISANSEEREATVFDSEYSVLCKDFFLVGGAPAATDVRRFWACRGTKYSCARLADKLESSSTRRSCLSDSGSMAHTKKKDQSMLLSDSESLNMMGSDRVHHREEVFSGTVFNPLRRNGDMRALRHDSVKTHPR